MSLGNVKTQMAAALATVTWTIPQSALGILNPPLNTQFGTVGSQQFAGEESGLDASKLPYVRIAIPTLDEMRKTSGGDANSYKDQRIPVHLFIYQAGFNKDWQGLADYFDAVIDATLAYFRRNSAPQGAGQVAGDVIRSWGLHQSTRLELPDQYGDMLVFRATVAVDVTNIIV